MITLLWIATLGSLALYALALATGFLRIERDPFFLAVAAQAFVYLHLAPSLAATQLPAETQSIYTTVEWLALLMLELPSVAVYGLLLRARSGPQRPSAGWSLSPTRSLLFALGACALAVGYLYVSLANGLLYRRIGLEIAAMQMNLGLVAFSVYRYFIELGPFLVGTAIVARRLAPAGNGPSDAVLRFALGIVTATYLLYALVNSRLAGVLLVVLVFGLFLTTRREGGVSFTSLAVGLTLATFASLYAIRVVSTVRDAFAAGRPVLDPAYLWPFQSIGQNDDSVIWRLNGIDLIAQVAPSIAHEGPALGAAWLPPLLVSLDPLLRTDATTSLKLAGLTTAKTFLMARYAGSVVTDTYSCMLSDAYGNFGNASFLAVGLTLALLMGLATRALHLSRSPARILVAVFVVSRVLPFEQEFASLLFGWWKLVPVVVLVLCVGPLVSRPALPAPA